MSCTDEQRMSPPVAGPPSGRVRLYYRPDTASMAPHAVLAEVEADYELVAVSRDVATAPGGWYRAISPFGTVPALELPDGSALWESASVAVHVAEMRPEARLLPPPGTVERAQVRQWLGSLSTALQPALMRRSYPERFTARPDGVEAVRRAAFEECGRLFDLIDGELGRRQWLAGDQRSVADFTLFMLVYWTRDDRDPAWSRRAIRRHSAVMLERPGVQRMLVEQGLPRPALQPVAQP